MLVAPAAVVTDITSQGEANAAQYNRILHPDDVSMAAALAGKGPYSEAEILDAMRWSNGRNTNGTVSPATQQAYGMDGTSLGANSSTGTLSGDLSSDPGLRVVPTGNSASSASFQEALPSAPSRDLMNFITASTGGSSSPYQFNTAGMTYGPTSNSSSTENPQYFSCASITCLAYGANYNPNNPINQAYIQQTQDVLAAAGVIASGPAVVVGGAMGVPALLGATAAYNPYTSGIVGAGVSGAIYSARTIFSSYYEAYFDVGGQSFAQRLSENFSAGQLALSMTLGYGVGAFGAGAYQSLGVPNSGIAQAMNPTVWPAVLPIRAITGATSAAANWLVNQAPGSDKK